MLTWYFYSVPGSKTPSPYFRRVPTMLRDLSRKGIIRFRLWQGRHEAPIPLSDGTELQQYEPILPAEPWRNAPSIGTQS